MTKQVIISDYARQAAHNRRDIEKLDRFYGSWIELRSRDQLVDVALPPLIPPNAPKTHVEWLADLPNAPDRYAQVEERRVRIEMEIKELRETRTIKGKHYHYELLESHMLALQEEYRYIKLLQAKLKSAKKWAEEKIHKAHSQSLRYIRDQLRLRQGVDQKLLILIQIEEAVSEWFALTGYEPSEKVREAFNASRTLIRAYGVELAIEEMVKEFEKGSVEQG